MSPPRQSERRPPVHSESRRLSSPCESKGRAPIEALGIWLTIEEAAVLLGLLELLPDSAADASPELLDLRQRWQDRLGSRMSEAITGLAPDGIDRASGD